tara:strand:- start:2816 stop:3727 length:912 start_codon:yes stop_codon:yes gene_type:complete
MDCALIQSLAVQTSSSIAMTVLNKYCTNVFKNSTLIVIFQMVLGMIFVVFFFDVKLNISHLKWAVTVPPTIFIMILSGMYALQISTVGNFVIFRNCIPIATYVIEVLLSCECQVTSYKMSGLFLIFLGTVMYNKLTLSSVNSILALSLNIIVCSLDRLLEKHLLMTLDIDYVTISFLNNAFGLLPLIVYLTFYFQPLHDFYALCTMNYINMFLIVSSSLCGILLNAASVVLQKNITASQMTIINTSNKIVLVIASMFIFHDSKSIHAILGICVSFLGCIMFSWDIIALSVTRKESEEELLTPR